MWQGKYEVWDVCNVVVREVQDAKVFHSSDLCRDLSEALVA